MTRSHRPGPAHPDNAVALFAAGLRDLRAAAGSPSFREMARLAHYSRTTLAAAAAGHGLPSLPVALAFAAACGGDVEEWRSRWTDARGRLDAPSPAREYAMALARPPGSPQSLVDGADPERSGCAADAVTLCAAKVAVSDHHIVGQVQLRFSPWGRAAWARFEGTSGLDEIARRERVEIQIATVRGEDVYRAAVTEAYLFDYHWPGIVLVGAEPVRAEVVVTVNGEARGSGRTLAVSLA